MLGIIFYKNPFKLNEFYFEFQAVFVRNFAQCKRKEIQHYDTNCR